MKTTLNKIREHKPCLIGWKKLLKHLGKTKADDAELSLITILDSNGLNDALWCLRSVEGHDKEIRLFAVWCARQVQHLLSDRRSLRALDVAEAFANGKATQKQLNAAYAAAGNAWSVVQTAADAAAQTDARDGYAVANAAAWAAYAAAYAAARDVYAAVNGTRDDTSQSQENELRRICKELS